MYKNKAKLTYHMLLSEEIISTFIKRINDSIIKFFSLYKIFTKMVANNSVQTSRKSASGKK